jgi:hypothetical protein
MRIGYARVPTTDQNPELQVDALLTAGIDRRHLFEDCMSGLRTDRSQLANARCWHQDALSLPRGRSDSLAAGHDVGLAHKPVTPRQLGLIRASPVCT